MLFQIGNLKKGLNPPSATDLVFVSPYMGTAIKTGFVTGIIALAVKYLSISFPLVEGNLVSCDMHGPSLNS